MKTKDVAVNKNYSKILLDYESHYIRKNGDMTYCGKTIPKGVIGSGTIEIVTCNKCTSIFILGYK